MRRTTNGGMRLVDAERLLSIIPEDADRVGLVGAAVSDHPQIVSIVESLVERGAEVGISSLRPDRLSDPFVGALKRAGYKTLTTAMDGASDRVREILDRRARTKHLVKAAELARARMACRASSSTSCSACPARRTRTSTSASPSWKASARTIPVALTIAPFCAKRKHAPRRPALRRYQTRRQADRSPPSRAQGARRRPRHQRALGPGSSTCSPQGGAPEAMALYEAVRAGGKFGDYKRAFAAREEKTTRRRLFIVRSAPRDGKRTERWLEPTP